MSDVFAVPGSASRLDRVLHDLLRRAPELEAAAVVSFDGLPMASALPVGFDEDRVAAMSAALLSLGERAAQGLGRGSLNQVYIEGEDGTVFLVSADDEAVLVAVGARGAKVGLLLFEVRRGALAVADTLRHEEVSEPAGYVGRDVVAPLPVHVAGHEAVHEAPAAYVPLTVVEPLPVVEELVEAVHHESPAPEAEEAVSAAYAPTVFTPSYSNLTTTPAYPTYDGAHVDAEDQTDDYADLPIPVHYAEPVSEVAPVSTPSAELGSWATFTPGGSLNAPTGQGLDPWI